MGMKGKTIKTVLQKKFNEWVDSISDENVRELVRKNSIITGGSIVSMLLGEKINDFDVYFRNQQTAETVAKYYVNEFKRLNPETNINPVVKNEDGLIKVVVKSAGVAAEAAPDDDYEYFEQSPDPDAVDAAEYVARAAERLEEQAAAEDQYLDKYRPIFLTSNAITLSHRMQLVLRFYGEPEEIHENYDYVHCTSYWTSWDKHLELRPQALEAILARELRYIGSKYPLCSILRMRKFIQRGWTINAGNILKILMQVNALDLNDPMILEEQLTGVDVAYFIEVIEKLRDSEHFKQTGRIDNAYLFEILDRMF